MSGVSWWLSVPLKVTRGREQRLQSTWRRLRAQDRGTTTPAMLARPRTKHRCPRSPGGTVCHSPKKCRSYRSCRTLPQECASSAETIHDPGVRHARQR
ncbi:hypothetical protein NDU88_004418 [Pleurodeles waltl]|uniref:Secreted protein n=1 Tax=Pleurodeles waltl TaxID=8319 RepID=A0AAV7M6A6_PLEWA|nr:hypothetical protein NDU88_004418 [Pleurodeles waltl]